MRSYFAQFDETANGFTLQQTDIPPLQSGEMLVRNLYTTICRSDLYTFQGKRKEKSPTILGHEIVGHIVAMANDVHPTDLRGSVLEVGNRITWGIYASNPNSVYAAKGIPQKADDLFKYGHEQITADSTLHGGLAEYIILRKNTPIVVLHNNTVLNEVASLVNCSVATVAGAIRVAGNLAGQTVLVSGTGMLGVIACAMAKTAGAATVIAVDADQERAKRALLFGADLALDTGFKPFSAQHDHPHPAAPTVDVVLEFSGMPVAMEATVALLDVGGTAVWIGATFPQASIAINAEKVIRKVLTIKGLHNYNQHDLVAAVVFMEAEHQTYDFASLVHGGFSLDQTSAAYQYAIDHNPFRVGIDLITKNQPHG